MFQMQPKINTLMQRHYTYFCLEIFPINNTTLSSRGGLQLKMFSHFYFYLNVTTKSNYELCLFPDNRLYAV